MRVSDEQANVIAEHYPRAWRRRDLLLVGDEVTTGDLAADLLDARRERDEARAALADIATGRHRFDSEAAERALGGTTTPTLEAVARAAIRAAGAECEDFGRHDCSAGYAATRVRALASDPAALAAIIKAATEAK